MPAKEAVSTMVSAPQAHARLRTCLVLSHMRMLLHRQLDECREAQQQHVPGRWGTDSQGSANEGDPLRAYHSQLMRSMHAGHGDSRGRCKEV